MSDTRTRFSLEIENIRLRSPDVSYIELIADYCEKNEIDFTTVPKLLTINLKQKIAIEAKRLNNINDVSDHYSMDNLL